LDALEKYKEVASEKAKAEFGDALDRVEQILNRIAESPLQYVDAVPTDVEDSTDGDLLDPEPASTPAPVKSDTTRVIKPQVVKGKLRGVPSPRGVRMSSGRTSRSLFQRLTTLFRSGNVAKQKIRTLDTSVASPDKTKSSGAIMFQKSASPTYANITANAYNLSERLMRYQDFCFGRETLVYTLDGVFTIEELSKMYPKGEQFFVYSYDHEKKTPTIGTAFFPRVANGGAPSKVCKVTFDDGGHVFLTPDHRVILRDGTAKEVRDLRVGDSLMPLYVKDITGHGYNWIYMLGKKTNFKSGWLQEHVFVASHFDREPRSGECVHHKDFNRKNNHPSNLVVMNESDHQKYHAQLNNKNKRGIPNQRHSDWMRTNGNRRRDVTFQSIVSACLAQDTLTLADIVSHFDTDVNAIKLRLKEAGFRNWEDFESRFDEAQRIATHEIVVKETRTPTVDEIVEVAKVAETVEEAASRLSCTRNAIGRRLQSLGYKNWTEYKTGIPYSGKKRGPKYDGPSFQVICSEYKPGMTKLELAAACGTSHNKVMTCIRANGYHNYSDWVNSFNNHKVSSIEECGEDVVYTVTVEKHHNLAVGSISPNDDGRRPHSMIFCHQCEMEYTPEIASALDIYADEACLSGDSVIPLLNGTRRTIADLYANDAKDFWVYSYDLERNAIVPGKATSVVRTGTKQLFRIEMDDGTFVRLTDNHRVLLSSGEYVFVRDLREDDSIRSLYTSTSSKKVGDKIDGYEKVLTSEGWKFTHRLIAEFDDPNSSGIVHHVDFDKRNNSPENLRFMTWKDHLDLHGSANVERWKDDSYSQKMRDVFRDRAKRLHMQPGFTRHLLAMRDAKFSSYDADERRRLFARSGAHNGMHGNGWKISGIKNGRWDERFVRRVTREQIIEWIESGKSKRQVCDELPMRHDDMTRHLRQYGIKKWTKKNVIDQSDVMQKLGSWRGRQPCGLDLRRHLKRACADIDIDVDVAYRALKLTGYRNWSDFLERTNHRVKSIVPDGVEDVYDITVDRWHNFAVTGSPIADSFVFVHNCSVDEKGQVLHVYSDNPKIKDALEHLFYDNLNVGFNLRSWTRNTVKYGDLCLYNDVSPEYGVINAVPIPINEIEREENYDPNDPLAHRFRWVTNGNRVLENWEVSHFRLLGNDMFLPYGSSVIEAARRIWRQLILVEDAMLVYRIVRAPERRVYYIDVGNIPPADVELYMEEQKKRLRSSQVVDRTSSRVDLRYNPLSIDEDIFVPVRGQDTGTKIETLAGGQNAAAVEDVAYIQKKLFAALKVPRAYLGYDESLSSKSTLAQEDIRFSRTINTIQRTMIAELNKLAIIHLYVHGFDDDDLQNFVLRMCNPSTIAQQQKLELWRAKFELAGSAPEGYASKDFVRKELWGLNDEQCKTIDEQRLKEKLVDAAIEGAMSGESEGGDMDLGDLGGEETEEPTGGEEAGGEELTAGDDVDEKDGKDLLTAGDDVGDDDEIPIKFDLDDVTVPVKAQRQLDKALYDRARIKHGGPAKTHMPDFAKMTGAGSKRDSDPFDSEFLSSFARNQLGESESRTTHRTSVSLDTVHMLRKMAESPKFAKSPGRSISTPRVIVEEVEDVPDQREFDEVYVIDEDELCIPGTREPSPIERNGRDETQQEEKRAPGL
jgi:hypothetical protein